MPNLPAPPSSITGPLGDYLHRIWRAFDDLPTLSYFIGTSPNSTLTGVPGDLAVNVGSASTDTRVWLKGGATRTPSTTGWVTLRTGPS